MFECDLCERTIGPRVPQRKVVVKRAALARGGSKIVKEIAVCGPCEQSLSSAAKAGKK